MDKQFDAAEAFVNASTGEFCAKFLRSFDAWIKRLIHPVIHKRSRRNARPRQTRVRFH
jgi:hypothetical protein